MKYAIEIRGDLITIRESAGNGASRVDVMEALDQVLYEIDIDEMQDLENYLIEQEFNQTFGNGNNPYLEVQF